MNKLRILLAFALVICLGDVAMAQSSSASGASVPEAPPELDPDEAVLPYNPDTVGKGIKIGEGTVFNPIVGLETGIVSNVFYEQNNETSAALARLLIEVGLSSLPMQRQGVGEAPTGDNTTNGPAETAATTSKGDF